MADDTPWLTADELAAWLAYRAGTTLLEAALDRQLQQDAGIPLAYYQILAMLSEAPGRTRRMGDLAALTRFSQSRLSHAVSRLEHHGWVRRSPSPGDRRSTLATLTGQGHAALAAAAPGHVRAVRALVLDRLTPGQVAQLHAIFRAVADGLGCPEVGHPAPEGCTGVPGDDAVTNPGAAGARRR